MKSGSTSITRSTKNYESMLIKRHYLLRNVQFTQKRSYSVFCRDQKDFIYYELGKLQLKQTITKSQKWFFYMTTLGHNLQHDRESKLRSLISPSLFTKRHQSIFHFQISQHLQTIDQNVSREMCNSNRGNYFSVFFMKK